MAPSHASAYSLPNLNSSSFSSSLSSPSSLTSSSSSSLAFVAVAALARRAARGRTAPFSVAAWSPPISSPRAPARRLSPFAGSRRDADEDGGGDATPGTRRRRMHPLEGGRRRGRRGGARPLVLAASTSTAAVPVFDVDGFFPDDHRPSDGGGDSVSSPVGASFSPLGATLSELSETLEGSGRARAVWDCLREGVDPNVYYGESSGSGTLTRDDADGVVREWREYGDTSDVVATIAWTSASESASAAGAAESSGEDRNDGGAPPPPPASLLSKRNQNRGLGRAALERLQESMGRYRRFHDLAAGGESNCGDDVDARTIENTIASLSHATVSPDGTVKLLSRMVRDGLEVESVIIPWWDKNFSTLCVSSQVGCRQGCSFCATGRMGEIRSLSTDEIVVQAYLAAKFRRVTMAPLSPSTALPPIDNVVFMGMGEPANNAAAVIRAANLLVDRRAFGLAQTKVTISTVAPGPESFAILGEAPTALAWSVHAADDDLRRKLVPTMRHSLEELRLSLVSALRRRSKRLRGIMLEAAIIRGVNDSSDDAARMADLAVSIMDDVPGCKAVVNLIPFNDIGHPTHRAPSSERVAEFQQVVTKRGVLCYVRTTRGDGDSAACGQLATRMKRRSSE